MHSRSATNLSMLGISSSTLDNFLQSVSLEENTGNIEEREPVGQVFEDRAKEYRTWAEIAIVASVLFCFFPFSFICLIVAYLSSREVCSKLAVINCITIQILVNDFIIGH